jgi:hypothetical protein
LSQRAALTLRELLVAPTHNSWKVTAS